MFVFRDEAPGENKAPGPPAGWTMCTRPAHRESVGCQCLCVCVRAHTCVLTRRVWSGAVVSGACMSG